MFDTLVQVNPSLGALGCSGVDGSRTAEIWPPPPTHDLVGHLEGPSLGHPRRVVASLATMSMMERLRAFATFEESAVVLGWKAFDDSKCHADKIVDVLSQGFQAHRGDRLVESVGLIHLREGNTDFDHNCR